MGYMIKTKLPMDHPDRAWTDSTVKMFNEDLGDGSYETVSSYLRALFSERRIANQMLVVVEEHS